jgi:hypothetical protein
LDTNIKVMPTIKQLWTKSHLIILKLNKMKWIY